MASSGLGNGVGSSRSSKGVKASSSSVDWLTRDLVDMRIRDKVETDDDRDSEPDIIDGAGTEPGHVIRTTLRGRNGQSRQTVSYISEHVVGTGSFGMVFQAKCRETGEIVAIKKVLQDKRYKNRELQIMQMLDHPNVVALKHSFYTRADNEEVYLNLVLEFVPETVNRAARSYTRTNQLMPLIYVKLYTYQYKTYSDASAAKEYIKEQGVPIVIKADGLAAGKGVTVAMELDEAYDAVDSMLVEGVFGSAGCQVIVEEFLEGEEASFFALVDGENAIPLESAQDHKRVGDGDTGPNTGGMGAYSPAPVLTKELQDVVMETIIHPTVKGMAEEGCKFVGVLFAGLMIEKKSGLPKLIEFNVRFGDPECQVLMMRLESDLAKVLLAACKGELSGVSLDWSKDSAMVVVMASKGYPGAYEKGTIIRNLEEAERVAPGVKVFHAGTDVDAEGNVVGSGGRVLGVTAMGKDLEEARERAYLAVQEIKWPGGFFRSDIGWRALRQKQVATKE